MTGFAIALVGVTAWLVTLAAIAYTILPYLVR